MRFHDCLYARNLTVLSCLFFFVCVATSQKACLPPSQMPSEEFPSSLPGTPRDRISSTVLAILSSSGILRWGGGEEVEGEGGGGEKRSDTCKEGGRWWWRWPMEKKEAHQYYRFHIIIQRLVSLKFPYMGKPRLTFCSDILLTRQPCCVVFCLQCWLCSSFLGYGSFLHGKSGCSSVFYTCTHSGSPLTILLFN